MISRYTEDRVKRLSLRRIRPYNYTVTCDKGHNYGMLNAPQREEKCCVWAMAEALLYEVERVHQKEIAP